MTAEPRSKREPQAGLSITTANGEGVIFLTVPEDTLMGERVALWTTPKALLRLRREIDQALTELETA